VSTLSPTPETYIDVFHRPKSAALEPEWLSAVAKSKDRLVSFDCSGDESPCDREGIDSLPFIVFFQNGDTVKHYQGPSRAEA
jgi:hypothetical protein